ncbi:MAG: hypothetical protein GX854_03805 [Clostridiales bacterium]|nr:hypothetical protein [Clostridiales bacterium]
MQLNIKEMYMNQEPFGQVICSAIIVLFIVYAAVDIIRVLWFQRVYKSLIRKKESPDQKPEFFEHYYLKNVYDQYIAAKQENANAVDLDSMLDKELPVYLRVSRNIISLFPGLMTALGLLGTFYGLSAAILKLITEFNQQFAFSNGGADMQSFKDMVDILSSPLTGMSTAFTSSLLGLSMSVIANLLHSIFFAHREERAFAYIVDYFENEVGLKYESGFDRAVIRLKDGLKESFDNFSGSVKDLSLNLKTSVAAIDQSAVRLNDAIDGLHGPVDNFRSSIELFKDGCNILDKQTEAIEKITARLSEELSNTLHKGLNELVSRMEQATLQFSDKLDMISSAQGSAVTDAVDNMKDLIGGMNRNLAASTASNQEIKQALSSLDSTYHDYQESMQSVNQAMENNYKLLLDLQGNIQRLSDNITDRLREALSDAVSTVMNESSGRMAKHLRQETDQMVKAVAETGRLLQELRENLNSSIKNLEMKLAELLDNIQHGNAVSREFFIQSLNEMTNKAAASYDDFHKNIIDLHETAALLQKALNHVIGMQIQNSEGGEAVDDIQTDRL